MWRPTQTAHLHVSPPASEGLVVMSGKAGVTSVLHQILEPGIYAPGYALHIKNYDTNKLQ